MFIFAKRFSSIILMFLEHLGQTISLFECVFVLNFTELRLKLFLILEKNLRLVFLYSYETVLITNPCFYIIRCHEKTIWLLYYAPKCIVRFMVMLNDIQCKSIIQFYRIAFRSDSGRITQFKKKRRKSVFMGKLCSIFRRAWYWTLHSDKLKGKLKAMYII